VVRELTAKNKEALQYTKRVYEGTRTRSFAESQEYETAMLFDLSQATNDAWIERGIAAFTQGRYKPAMEAMKEEGEPFR
jgi:hypothetical protein